MMIPKTFKNGGRRAAKRNNGRYAKIYEKMRVQPELKSLDLVTTLASNTTGAISLLNGCAQGTALHERVGRQIRLRSLTLKGMLSVTAATGVDQFLRYLVVRDSQSNAAAPAITDVLDTVSTVSQANISNVERFAFVLDRCVYLNAAAEPGAGKSVTYSTSLNCATHFNVGNAGTVADITKNSLYLIVIGSVAPGATAGSVDFNTRIRFSDE
jgi:hypothetical protein